MKAIFCMAFFLITCTTIVAQNVGIGMLLPEAKLTVGHISTQLSPTLGLVETASTGGPRLHFSNEGGTTSWIIAADIDHIVPANSSFRFAYGGLLFPTFIIRGNNTVGINQALPAYPLDVTGDVNLTGALRIDNATGSTGQALISNGASSPTWQSISQNPVIGFSGRVNGNVSLPTNTFTTITTYEQLFDDGNNFDPATGQFTAPAAGLYQFHLQANFSVPTVNDVNYSARFLVNGLSTVGCAAFLFSPPSPTAVTTGISHTISLKLAANDVVVVQVNQASGTTLNLLGNNSTANSVFSGFRIY